MLGVVPVFYAFKPATAAVRNAVVLCFSAIFIAYGIVHGAYVAIAATSKVAVQNQLDIEVVTALASHVNHILRYFIYPFFALLSYLFISQVWKRKTLYSRWMILFFPLVPFLFQGLISRALSGPAWIVFSGGFFNLILVLFFMASTINLWNNQEKSE